MLAIHDTHWPSAKMLNGNFFAQALATYISLELRSSLLIYCLTRLVNRVLTILGDRSGRSNPCTTSSFLYFFKKGLLFAAGSRFCNQRCIYYPEGASDMASESIVIEGRVAAVAVKS